MTGGIKPEFLAAVKALGKVQGHVGWLESAEYPDGRKVADNARTHEYGAPAQGIPPRPFMRTAIADHQNNWIDATAKAVKEVLAGKTDAVTAMGKVAMIVEGDVKQAIVNVTSPALNPATIKARARKLASGEVTETLNKPLVESALMLKSLTSEASKK
ncbi:hypothetical protein [Limnohabitans sp.]|uniref:hypothetical protein n=1 Tax=Limnohabitans sp. TaxID=1907725 RepID=UPI00286F4E76|nr:hypothetical protein [Limnohabitans sp.]